MIPTPRATCNAQLRPERHFPLMRGVGETKAGDPDALGTGGDQRLPAGARLLIDAARVDPSGRIWITMLLRAVRWDAGHRIGLRRSDHVLVVRAAAGGGHSVGAGGSLALPAAHRRMSGIDTATTVLVAADVDAKTLLVCPVNVIGSHINDLYTRAVGEQHGR